MKVADIFGVPSPSQLISDCRALDLQGVAGYAYDDDVNSVNPWTPDHVTALQTAGIPFLPIITLRSGTQATISTLKAALQVLGWTSGPVGWDIEDTATPPFATVSVLVAGLRAAGYGPMTAYFWPAATWQPIYGSLFDRLWWGGGSTSLIPQGWHGIQYGQVSGPSGNKYDLDNFDPSIFDPPALEALDMPLILVTAGQPALYCDGPIAQGIPDQDTENALTGANVKVAAVTASFYAGVYAQAAAVQVAAKALQDLSKLAGGGQITLTPTGQITLTGA